MILCVLQARMSSKRLPGKVLKKILGVPMLLYQYRRLLDARLIDQVIVATSTDHSDDPIREMCAENRIMCYGGPLDDVLDRFYWLAMLFRPNHVVRTTGDCPLIDPEVVDDTIKTHLMGGYDYTRATTDCGWPDGLDTEVFTLEALAKAWRDARDMREMEHVTLYMRNHPELFKHGRYVNTRDESSIKLSVDTEEDFIRVERIIHAFSRWA